MKYEWHDFDNLETADQLTDYLDGREFTHGVHVADEHHDERAVAGTVTRHRRCTG